MLKSTLQSAPCGRLRSAKLRATLRWLDDNLGRFRPWHHRLISSDGLKAFAELAIVYAQLERHCGDSDDELGATLTSWREFIVRHSEHPAYGEQARKRPAYAFHLLLPYLILRGRGYRWSYHESTLSALARWGYPAVTEVVPYRLLDRAYFLWKAGCLAGEPDWLELYRGTALANIGSLVYLEKEVAYSVTHTVFYLSDFGRQPMPLPPMEICRIAGVIESLLLHYWRLENWDLTGELLINLHYLGHTDSIIYDGARRAFERAIRPEGCIPADRGEDARIERARKGEKRSALFGACYHTTLVGVLHFLSMQDEEA